MFKSFIPGLQPEMPKNYGIKIEFHVGKAEELEVVDHVIDQFRVLHVFLKDETTRLYPLDGIRTIGFDRRWLKLIELKGKK